MPGAALLLAVLAMPVGAQSSREIDHAEEYRACLALTRVAPEDAFESALAWESAGGGEPARHCAAVALIYLDQFEEAAHRLELMADRVATLNPRLAAEALAQAGQAWTMAEQTDRALGAQNAALKLSPDDVELLIDRSITLAGKEQFWEAIDDLNRASELAPDRVDVLVFRSSAYRMVEANDLAMEDVTRALTADPHNPEGLLERGILKSEAGDADGARQDWMQVLKLVPEGPVGQAARNRLEKLDVKVE